MPDWRPSEHQRKLLLDHIDGPQMVVVENTPRKTRAILVHRGLLMWCNAEGNRRPYRSNYTALTESGRMVLAGILAEYAEALVRAGCLDPSALPIELSPRHHAAEPVPIPALTES